MKKDLFAEFKEFFKEKNGYELVESENGVEMSFEKLFGGSFIAREKDYELPDEKGKYMGKIYAVCTTLKAGLECDKYKMIRSGIKVGDRIELKDAVVDTWHTDIYLVGYDGSFNSVFFNFEDESGNMYDIYSDERFLRNI